MTSRLRIGLLGLACAGTAAAGCSRDNRTPESCEDIQRDHLDEHDDFPEDGEYTVYADGEKSRPWTVWCENMNRNEPKDYLTVHASDNYSELSDGVDMATTVYSKVRIDPIRFEVDPWDFTFANTTGFTSLLNDPEFKVDVGLDSMATAPSHIPYGVAFRETTGAQAQDATAHIDLVGTGFVLAEDVIEDEFFCIKETITTGNSLASVEMADDLGDVLLIANATASARVFVSSECDTFGRGTRIPLQYDGFR